MLLQLWQDAVELARGASGATDGRSIWKHLVTNDSYRITALFRLREAARRLRLPGVNHALRVVQTAFYGIELGSGVTLGHGVYFVHPLGVVVGGDARIGNRVRFLGSNTVGTAKDNGYPMIDDDVVVGCGARILGPIRIGPRAVIGANAVVLTDVPADHVAVGIPARIMPRTLRAHVVKEQIG